MRNTSLQSAAEKELWSTTEERICIQQFHATICFFYYTIHLCLKIGLLFCRWTTGKSGQNKPRQKMYISWIQCCCEKNQTWTYEQSIPWWSTCSLGRGSGVMSREMNTNGCSSRGPHRRCFNININKSKKWRWRLFLTEKILSLSTLSWLVKLACDSFLYQLCKCFWVMKHLAHQVIELDAEIDTTNASRCLA